MSKLIILVIFFLYNSYECHSLELPDYIPKCYHAENEEQGAELGKCFRENAHLFRDVMRSKGIPEVGIPRVDFVVLPRIELQQKSRAYSYKIAFTNIGITGLDEYFFDVLTFHLKNTTFNGFVRFDMIHLNGTYQVEGKIFGQEIKQSGPMEANINNTVLWVQMSYEVYKKKGVSYANITDLLANMEVGHADGKFHNLFGENQVLNKATDEFLKESAKQILDTAKPEVTKLIRHILRSAADAVTTCTYDSIFLPRHK